MEEFMDIKGLLLFLIITQVVLLMNLIRYYSNKRIIEGNNLIKINLYQRRNYLLRSIKLPEVLSDNNAKEI